MAFKINISDKGKTYKIELESEEFVGKKIGDKLSGNEVSQDLTGYELQITGTSDKSGFAGKPDVEGIGLKRVLLTKGPFLKRVPHKGFRRKKTVRGNQISLDTVQINMKVVKEGGKKIEDIFKKEEAKDDSGKSGSEKE
ncbi:MAG: S6e family ribosomal protein [Nanoarchaeota archaeon]|nr:S6e family ribosomal protein [Nanoarchaeota archaeon]